MTPLDKLQVVNDLYKDQAVPIVGPRKRAASTLIKSLAIGLLFVSLVGWLLFFIVNNLQATPTGTLVMKISAPDTVSPGIPFEYIIELENNDVRNVENVLVRVNYPEGFLLKSSEPTPSTVAGNTWEIGKINTNDKSSIKVQGVVYGESDVLRTLFVSTSYELEGFKSGLELSDSVAIKLGESTVSINAEVGEIIVGNKTAAVTIEVENVGDVDVEGLRLKMSLPQGVTYIEGVDQVEVTDGEIEWGVEVVEAKSTSSYTVNLTWGDDISGDVDLSIVLLGLAQSGIDIGLAEEVIALPLGELPTLVAVSQIGEPSDSGVVLTRVIVTNYLANDLSVSKLSVNLSGGVDWEKMLAVNDVERSQSDIVWSTEQITQFGIIAPNESMSLPLTIPLNDNDSSVIVTPMVSVVLDGQDGEIESVGTEVSIPKSAE